MRQGCLKTIKAEVTGERIAATEGFWAQIVVIYKYLVYINYMGAILIEIL